MVVVGESEQPRKKFNKQISDCSSHLRHWTSLGWSLYAIKSHPFLTKIKKSHCTQS